MLLAPKSWLSAVCLYVQAVHLAVSDCLWRLFPSTESKYLQRTSHCQSCRKQLIECSSSFVREKRHHKYWLFEKKRGLQMDGNRVSDCIKYWSKCLFHTKETIIIEKGFIGTIILCCRLVNKSMPPILWQREQAWEGNKGISATQVNQQGQEVWKEEPDVLWLWENSLLNSKLQALWGVSKDKI